MSDLTTWQRRWKETDAQLTEARAEIERLKEDKR